MDVEGSNEPAENVGSDNHAEATDQVACVPRIRLTKSGPSLAHVGDTVTYVFTATNTGGVALSNIDLTDPKCDSAPTLTADGNGDAVLAVNEHWTFRCDHTITAGDGDPVHNVATVTGDHEGGTVSDTDTHDVDVIHPDIELEKTASPTSGPAGTTIVYTYAVTNTGDTTLFDISIDDDTLGHVGDIPSLAAGQTAERTFEITLGSSPITNVATARGADVLGGSVSDVDDATVTVVAGGGGRRRGRHGRRQPLHRIRHGSPLRLDRAPRGPRLGADRGLPEASGGPPGGHADRGLTGRARGARPLGDLPRDFSTCSMFLSCAISPFPPQSVPSERTTASSGWM